MKLGYEEDYHCIECGQTIETTNEYYCSLECQQVGTPIKKGE